MKPEYHGEDTINRHSRPDMLDHKYVPENPSDRTRKDARRGPVKILTMFSIHILFIQFAIITACYAFVNLPYDFRNTDLIISRDYLFPGFQLLKGENEFKDFRITKIILAAIIIIHRPIY